jgi:hypothetical protein
MWLQGQLHMTPDETQKLSKQVVLTSVLALLITAVAGVGTYYAVKAQETCQTVTTQSYGKSGVTRTVSKTECS